LACGGTDILTRRRDHFRRLAQDHERRSSEGCRPGDLAPEQEQRVEAIRARRARYHVDLYVKYAQAARYPWLQVEADPPEPE
jgi:hypothetical protein